MHFKPNALPTVAGLIAITLLSSLGRWQLQRHTERNIGYRASQTRHPLPPLHEESLLASSPDDLWRRVELTGQFIPPLNLESGRNNHHRPGYEVFQTFKSKSGVPVLVDRGWIPHSGRKELFPALLDERTVQLKGQLRPAPVHPVKSVLSTQQDVLTWPPAASASIYVQRHHAAYLVAGPPFDSKPPPYRTDYPVSGYAIDVFDKTSLAYAIQWFLMAGSVFALWLYGSLKHD